jgi:hypothetical protein
MAYDRLLVLSAVCFELFNKNDLCALTQQDLDNKYDGRTPAFFAEFRREIKRTIRDEISLVKKARKSEL